MTIEFKDFNESKLTICEDRKDSGYMKVRGTFQKAETRNANGRIYPSSLWERVLSDISLKNTLESRRMLGCVEHPTSGVTALSEVSHIVTGLTRQGNEIIGEAELLNTPQGLIIQELLRRGVPVGISSRGRGSAMMRNGVEYVNPDDFILETFDFVYKPSTPGAYPELQESVLAGSPFAKNTPMSAKIDQIKKFDVRTTEIVGAASGKVQLAELHKLHTESVEMQASMQALLKGFSDAEAKDNGVYANEVNTKIEGALQTLRGQLDKHYAGSDLNRRVESVLNNNTNTAGNDLFKSMLGEARQENEYLRSRLEELSEVLASSEDDLMRRYTAAAQLAEETLDKLHDLTSSLAEVTAERDEAVKRCEAAVELVAQLQEAQTQGQLALQVQEALDQYPELGKFQKTLRACKTKEELDERVEELVSGLNLNQKTESLSSRVKLSAAITESRKASQPTEKVDTKVLKNKNLTESAKKASGKRASADQILESSENTEEDPILTGLLEGYGLS